MNILTWWTRRQRVMSSLDALLHGHNRQSMEIHQMSLDLTKLREAQGRLTGAIESLVGVIAAQNQKIADLTAAAGGGTADQAAADAATADLVALADKAEAAAHPPIDPPPAPAP